MAIIHCPGHQKGDHPVVKGNNLADKAAKEAALKSFDILPIVLPDPGDRKLPENPEYTEEETRWAKRLPMSQFFKGWWKGPDGKLILPAILTEKTLYKIH